MSLPSGTITFLFTDIEGSTKLWERFPEAMRLALEHHDTLLKAAIEAHNGYIFKTVGDAFCAAFSTAPDALNAALEAHLALLEQDWGGTGPIRVRMGIHTGAAQCRDNDYFGPTVNRVARMQAIGHGQQTLLSQAAYALISRCPAEASLSDLGLHRLKDLAAPEHVWQLNHPSLPQEFPPLKSLNYLSTNLPQQLSSFIGREKEIQEINELLSSTRLLTLTGSGGTGKTRLSLQVAANMVENYQDGVWLVELAPLADSGLVPSTLSSVLHIKEEPGKPITQTLTEHLKNKHLLLMLDNCEHLLDASANLANELLKQCPGIRIIASSREALRIAGEQVFLVPSLSLPDPKNPQSADSLSHCEAVRLFTDRAVLAKPDFQVTDLNASAVASVCLRLDGIPLAIELAAARVRSMSVEEINEKLDQRFRLLTGGSRTELPRQQTLRSLIDWSYDLLEDNQKALLLRLSVFVGGWTLESAEKVCAGEGVESWEVLDLLTDLADKSLVIADTRGDSTRYRLLETVRQYGLDRLVESGEINFVRRLHRDYFLSLAEEVKPKLAGSEQEHWLSVLENEHDNLRAAVTFCLEQPDGGDNGLRLGEALWRFWHVRGHLSEGRDHLGALLSNSNTRSKARADALNAAGALAKMQGDYTSARAQHQQSLTICRELEDKEGIANSLNGLGNVAHDVGDFSSARALHNEGLAIRRELGNKRGIAASLINLGRIAYEEGEYIESRSLQEASLEIQRELGDKGGSANSLYHLGIVAYYQSDHAASYSRFEESLIIRRDLGDKPGIADSLNGLGSVVQIMGSFDYARTLFTESLAIQRELGSRWGIAASLNNLGTMLIAQGDFASARPLHEESLEILCALGDRKGVAESLEAFADLAHREEKHEQEVIIRGAASALREEIGSPLWANRREEMDQAMMAARAALGYEAFATLWDAGRAMTMERAIALALENVVT